MWLWGVLLLLLGLLVSGLGLGLGGLTPRQLQLRRGGRRRYWRSFCWWCLGFLTSWINEGFGVIVKE